MRTNQIKRCLPAVLVLSSVGSYAAADSARALPEVFTFAAGYKTAAEPAQNVVELGVIKRCTGSRKWCLEVRRYGSAAMLPLTPTPIKHVMHAPYRSPTCVDGAVTTIDGEAGADSEAAYERQADGFSVLANGMRYRWVSDPKVKGGYTLTQASDKENGQLTQVVGFAFQSASELQGGIGFPQLRFKYEGELDFKTAFTKVDGPWERKPSSFDFRKFEANAAGDVLSLSVPGKPSIVSKYKKPMWVHHTVVLKREASTLAPLVHEYGHDFNMDGCLNEGGHNKLMLPIGDNAVSAFVYIEYTPDRKRGFPMLSVGRYYR